MAFSCKIIFAICWVCLLWFGSVGRASVMFDVSFALHQVKRGCETHAPSTSHIEGLSSDLEDSDHKSSFALHQLYSIPWLPALASPGQIFAGVLIALISVTATVLVLRPPWQQQLPPAEPKVLPAQKQQPPLKPSSKAATEVPYKSSLASKRHRLKHGQAKNVDEEEEEPLPQYPAKAIVSEACTGVPYKDSLASKKHRSKQAESKHSKEISHPHAGSKLKEEAAGDIFCREDAEGRALLTPAAGEFTIWDHGATLGKAVPSETSPTSPVLGSGHDSNFWLNGWDFRIMIDLQLSGVWLDISMLSILRSNDLPVILGKGGFGTVYKGVLGEEVVAVKVIPSASVRPRRDNLEEMSQLKSGRHPNVVQLLGVQVQDGKFMMASEYLAGGDLHQRIRLESEEQITWYSRGWSIAEGIAEGVAYLHSKGIRHSDLKSPNILLTSDLTPKISDVGLLRLMTGSEASLSAKSSLHWTAPEQKDGESGSFPSDVWSLGAILWELCTGETPNRNRRAIRVPDEAPQSVCDLISMCSESKPSNRPTAAEVHAALCQAKI